jgi:hypothetical protein
MELLARTLFTFSVIACFVCLPVASLRAQSALERKISIDVTNRRLADVLRLISNRGNFYFSYNSIIIKPDSLVTLTASNRSVKQVLDQLFDNRYQFRENSNYIIIRRSAVSNTQVTRQTPTEEKLYTVTGFVLDGETGEKVSNASIYEKQRLVSTLTNTDGYFSIKLKSRYKTASLTVSRQSYDDTTVVIQPTYNQQVVIAIMPAEIVSNAVTIAPADFEKPDTLITAPAPDSIGYRTLAQEDSNQVEKTRLGKFFLSTKQQIQSLNVRKFFAERTFQVSVIPGVGTQGKLSGQVENNFSFNVFGGYTGGVNIVEIGGLFNINKRHVKYAQAAGLFNIAGGTVTGAQTAGLHNTALKHVRGLQAAGISNIAKGSFIGVQTAGIANHLGDSMVGAQLAGIVNHAENNVQGAQVAGIGNFTHNMDGAQIAGITNFTRDTVKGVQVAGILNYAKKLNGVQIGLINIADTSTGYSFGLINIVLKGYHKISLSSDETTNLGLAFKTGTYRFYSIFLASANLGDSNKIYSYGYGFGSEFPLIKKWMTLNAELTSQYLYLGDWSKLNLLSKIHLHANFKFGKYFSIFAGPSFAVYYTKQTAVPTDRFKDMVPAKGYHTFDLWDDRVKGWLGWQAGISFF